MTYLILLNGYGGLPESGLRRFLGQPLTDTLLTRVDGTTMVPRDLQRIMEEFPDIECLYTPSLWRWSLHGKQLDQAGAREMCPTPPPEPFGSTEVRARCDWYANTYEWALVPWFNWPWLLVVAFITRDKQLATSFEQCWSGEPEWSNRRRVRPVKMFGSYELQESEACFRRVFLIEPECCDGVPRIGKAVWDACSCERERPILRHFTDDPSDDIQGTRASLRLEIVERRHDWTYYRPCDEESFLRFCARTFQQSVDADYIFAGDATPDAISDTVTALEHGWIDDYDLGRLLEAGSWCYDLGHGDDADHSLFSARSASLVEQVARAAEQVFPGEKPVRAFF